jgi:integrase
MRIDLMTYLTDYYVLEVSLKPNTEAGYVAAVKRFEEFNGGPVYLEDLTPQLINRWVVAREKAGASPKTIHNQRHVILSLWERAQDEPELNCPELKRRKIRKVRVPRKAPEGFTMEEVMAMVQAAAKFRNPMKRQYWRAFVLTAYESCLRRDDLFHLTQADIGDDGIVTVTMEKTGDVHSIKIRPETVALLRKLPHKPLGMIWRSVHGFRDDYRRLKRWAGISGRNGLAQPLRRTGASYVERDNPGMGARTLGHRTPGMAERHYFIPGIVRSRIAPPPPSVDDEPVILPMIDPAQSLSDRIKWLCADAGIDLSELLERLDWIDYRTIAIRDGKYWPEEATELKEIGAALGVEAEDLLQIGGSDE